MIRRFYGACSFRQPTDCLGGAYYWGAMRDGAFLGATWGAEIIVRSATILAAVTLLWAVSIFVFSKLTGQSEVAQSFARGEDRIPATPFETPIPNAYWVIFVLGLAASLFVLKSSSFASAGDFSFTTRGPLFLIAYQFSDMLIPFALFMIATRGYTKPVLLIIAYFVFYAVLVGFRYKLALLFLPMLWDILISKRTIFFKLASGALVALGGLALFAVMTLYRAKFGMPDLSVPLANPAVQAMYGLFADTNVLFGFTSIIVNFADPGHIIAFTPILDAFKEWIPHFIDPDRVTGIYAITVVAGLGVEAGLRSGTAWPWLGEFMMMFGWPAVIFGPAIMLLVYAFFKSKLLASCATSRQYMIGLGLIAAMLAYYQFSRGYLPQIVKGYLFVLSPYIYLCYLDLKQRLVALAEAQ